MTPLTVDRAGSAGTREVVGWFGPGPEHLAGATYLPRTAAGGGVVIVPSICNDFLRSYRREVILARQLAEQGVAVQRFHYTGTGNSDGEELDLTYPQMVRDVTVARRCLADAAGEGPVAFFGTRFGALVAAAAATEVPGAPLVLVEPVVSGEKFFREAWRAPMAKALRDGDAPTPREALLAQLDEQGWVDVLGHTVGRALQQSSEDVVLLDALGDQPRPVLLVQLGGTSGLRPDNQRLATALAERGFPVDVEIAGDEQSWWFFEEEEVPPVDLVPSVAAWMAKQVAAAPLAARPAPVADRAGEHGPEETPGFFSAAGEDVFGILTSPVGEPRGACAVLLSGGVWTPSPGRNRIWVRMARDLAADGYHSLRLDYHGVGESTGSTQTFLLDAPFVEDALAGCAWAGAQGVSRMILFGSCFGARTALASAVALDDVGGVAVFPVPVRDFAMGEKISSLPTSVLARKAVTRRGLAGLLKADHRRAYRRIVAKKWRRARTGRQQEQPSRFEWVSPILLRQFRGLIERSVPILLLFGEDDSFYQDFLKAKEGRLGEVLEEAGELVQVRLVPGKTHGLATTAVQDAVVAELEGWLADLDGAAVTQPRASASRP